MSNDLKIDNEIDLEDDETGKMFLFWNPQDPIGIPYGFSSTLENIGHVLMHDCILKNKTEVLVLSEPIEAIHFKLGKLLVTRILADKIMWVGTNSLVQIDKK